MAEKVLEKAVDSFIQQGSNFKNLDENMLVLQKKIEELNCREADVRTELQQAELVSSKKRKLEVGNWLKNVDHKRRQLEGLAPNLQQIGPLNVVARRNLANQVVQEIDEVAKLFEAGRFPEGMVIDVAVKESVPLVTFKVKGYAFEQNLENIWAWLMDDEVVSIGIWGMGGVGKTTLAMHLHDKLLQEPKFSNCVYWVTVSQESNRFKLQNDIAKAMNIYISGEDDENKRTAILFRELSKREKFVLILDDVWEHFDVWKIGLPFKKHDCKFMLTSRSINVCERIGCKKLIRVQALSESEAWTLFQEELEQANLSREVERIAQDVVKKCGGLPLGIITMARSMRGVTDVYEWKDALVELKECMARGSMGNEVLPILLCSFNRLGNPKLQQCFLYCSLYPEDFEINRDELINMFILEELMDSRSRRQEAIDQGHVIMNKLENSCMLIRSQKGGVKMHDLMREMALWITSDDPKFREKPTNPRFMVKAGLQLKEIPAEMEYWKQDLDKVSLKANQIIDIPAGTSPNCPILSTLILRGNPFDVIPESFFMHMCGLKILNLSETNILQLPKSISDLVNLKALLLSCCTRLISLPSLKKLKELRELDLSFTNMKEVIDGMESLANLNCLNLDGASMEMLTPGIVRKLAHLQRLILPADQRVAVEEVEGLRSLEEFRGVFYSMSDLNKFIKSQHGKQLSVYDIGLLDVNNPYGFEDMIRYTCKKATIKKCIQGDSTMLRWYNGKLSINSYECQYLMMLQSDEETSGLLGENLKYLQLGALPNLMDIIKWEEGADRIPPRGTLIALRTLQISSCKRIKTLLPWGLADNLQNLEELHVSSCDQLEEIIGQDPQGSFSSGNLSNLIELNINRCGRIKTLLPWGLADNLQNLEKLHVSSCDQLEEIIGQDPQGSFSSGNLSNLIELNINRCGRIKTLLPWGLADNLQNLEKLHVSSCDQLEEIIGQDPQGSFSSGNLSNLRRLFIFHGGRIKTLLPWGLADNLQNLEKLDVRFCDQLEEIIGQDPQGSFSSGNLSNLRELFIYRCGRIKTLLPWGLADNLQNLKRLNVSFCDQLEEIIGHDPHGSFSSGNLTNLRELNITCCGRIKTLLPWGLADNLQNLQNLDVRCCDQLEEIIGQDPQGSFSSGNLSNLRRLFISYCGRIKTLPQCPAATITKFASA